MASRGPLVSYEDGVAHCWCHKKTPFRTGTTFACCTGTGISQHLTRRRVNLNQVAHLNCRGGNAPRGRDVRHLRPVDVEVPAPAAIGLDRELVEVRVGRDTSVHVCVRSRGSIVGVSVPRAIDSRVVAKGDHPARRCGGLQCRTRTEADSAPHATSRGLCRGEVVLNPRKKRRGYDLLALCPEPRLRCRCARGCGDFPRRWTLLPSFEHEHNDSFASSRRGILRGRPKNECGVLGKPNVCKGWSPRTSRLFSRCD